MVCIANYNDNLEVIGCTREDGVSGGIEFLSDCEALGMTITYKTQAELDKQAKDNAIYEARVEFKAERGKLVSELEITYNDVVYQADEVSQGRMSRAILALPDDTTTTLWIASDNTPMQVNRIDLSNMLRMAGEAQTAIWVG